MPPLNYAAMIQMVGLRGLEPLLRSVMSRELSPVELKTRMAGMAGLEPANTGVKVPCLTTWLHPNIMAAAAPGTQASSPLIGLWCGHHIAAKANPLTQHLINNETQQFVDSTYDSLTWSWWTGSNPRPETYKVPALPTELHQHLKGAATPLWTSLFHQPVAAGNAHENSLRKYHP